MKLPRQPAAVIFDADAVIRVNINFNCFCITRESLVDGVVDNLVNEVVQTSDAGVTDVHPWTLADGL